MTSCKKPIKRTLLIYGGLFLAVLCVLMSVQSGGMLRTALMQRYTSHMTDVLTYVEHSTDVDDIQTCIKTGEPSEKLAALQQQFNTMVDDFELLFIYALIPVDDGTGTVINICSSTSAEERAAGEEDLVFLNAYSDFYTAEELVPYLEAMKKPNEISEILVDSQVYGHTQTICKPLVASDGEVIGLLCVDLGHTELHRSIRAYVWSSIGLIVLITAIFSLIAAFWLSKNVTAPLHTLEAQARAFAENSRGKRDLSELTFNTPDIRTENEIQSLSDAITQMSEDMKYYVQDVLAAEKRAEDAEMQVEDIARMAYEDALTNAKSKVAYDTKKEELAKAIAGGTAEFAIVGVELEGADRINDLYGREARNSFISNACNLIDSVYQHSSVYRVADSIFAVLLEGDEYQKRDALFDELNEKIRASEDPNRKAWECCAAVTGMTEYAPGAEEDVGTVCRRLEMIMSRNWRIRKNS